MLNHPTLDQLKTLKLDGMAEAFNELETQDGTGNLGHAEWLGLLIDRETSSRATKRFESRIRSARLRHNQAVPEDVDYRARRNLDKALFQQLLSGKWIKDNRNLIITGPCDPVSFCPSRYLPKIPAFFVTDCETPDAENAVRRRRV